MDKKLLTIIVVVLALGGLFFLGRGILVPETLDSTQSLSVPEDATGITLTAEELQALKDEGLELSSSEDAEAKKLQSVRTSDEIEAIEADLDGTDLSGL